MDISQKFLEIDNVAPTLEEIMNFMNGEKTEEDKNSLLKSAIEVVEKNKIRINCFKKGFKLYIRGFCPSHRWGFKKYGRSSC
jgi:hypothetical protein